MKKLNLTLMLAVCCIAFSFAQIPTYVPTNGLVGWWPFNGNANDESGNGNNGTVNGATLTMDRFGNVGKAYDFDGVNDYISYQSGSSSSLNITGNLTISFWVKSTTILNNGIISFGDNAAGNGGYNVAHLSATNLNNISYISNNNSNNWIQTNLNYNNNIWNFFVISQKSDTVRIYKNNILTFAQTNYSFPTSYSGNRVIGTGSQLAYYFNGILDDIGIWNRALTQQEITDLYNGNICYQLVTVTDTLLINTGITGFNPITYENSIKIYPNPARTQITIDNGDLNLMNGYSLRIVNALGQQMFQSAINQQQFVINLSSWTGAGIYYVNLINPQGVTVETRKIVIQ